MTSPRTWPRARLLLLVAAVAAFAVGLLGPFQFDDEGVLLRDPSVRSLGAALGSMGLRPLLRLSYAACWALGLGPLGFHAFNLLVHVLNVELVLRVHALATRPDARTSGPPDTGAVVAGLLFALHPVHTEAVTYVSGRSASLSAALALLALLALVTGARRGSTPRRLVGAGLLVAAVLAKETAAVVVLGLVAWEALVERSPVRTALRRLALPLGLLGALALAAVLHDATFRLLLDVVGSRSPGEAFARQLEGLGWLLSRLVLVHRLSIDPGLGLRPADPAWVGVGAVGVAVLAAVATQGRRLGPAVAWGAAWFLVVAFLPYVLLPRLDVLNERHLYLADVGLFVGVGALAARATEAWPAARLRAAAVVAAALLGVATTARNLDYRSEVALWTQTVAVSPDNPRAHHNLGVALERAGRRDEAAAAYTRALALAPGFVGARERLEALGPR